jgi:hypothetical protein
LPRLTASGCLGLKYTVVKPSVFGSAVSDGYPKERLMAQIVEYEKNYKNIKAKISDGSIITGKMNILNFTRLSDYFKQSNDKFITIHSEETERGTKKATIVNKDHIIWADTWD